MKMKFAIRDGQRQEAQPGLSGECPVCTKPVIAKCGEILVWHWAHKKQLTCDYWWENETEWHRNWKKEFPTDWQEVIHKAKDGEKHFADIKTEHGRVIEFQHSYLRPEERRSRETFYRKMVWVVDGLRLPKSVPKFAKALAEAKVIRKKPLTLQVPVAKLSILRNWSGSKVALYIDFGVTTLLPSIFDFTAPVLWRCDPKSPIGTALLSPIWRGDFVAAMTNGSGIRGMDARKIVKPVLIRAPSYRRKRNRRF